MAEAGETPMAPPAQRGRILRAEAARDWLDGRQRLDEARREAAEIRQAARAAAEAERARGYREGYEAGAAAAASLLAETSARIDRQLAALPDELAEILLLAMARVLGGFDQQALLLQAVGHALDQRRGQNGMRLQAPPALAPKLRALIDELAAEAPGLWRIEVEADPKLAAESCVLVTDQGFVELGLDAQLAALRRGIRAALGAP
jgi:type III secretion protein L